MSSLYDQVASAAFQSSFLDDLTLRYTTPHSYDELTAERIGGIQTTKNIRAAVEVLTQEDTTDPVEVGTRARKLIRAWIKQSDVEFSFVDAVQGSVVLTWNEVDYVVYEFVKMGTKVVKIQAEYHSE